MLYNRAQTPKRSDVKHPKLSALKSHFKFSQDAWLALSLSRVHVYCSISGSVCMKFSRSGNGMIKTWVHSSVRTWIGCF